MTNKASKSPAELPPVLLLGGEANAISVSRSLSAMGVKVYAVGEADSSAQYSRFCHWIDLPAEGSLEETWTRFLLGPASDHLVGAVVLACSDAGIRVLTNNREKLLTRFRLDESNPVAQMAMLDKLTTYQHAIAAGVPTPKFWIVDSRQQVQSLEKELVYPLLVKPRMSHVFEQRFGKKFITVNGFDELLSALDTTNDAGVEVLLMELIPGPDTQLCSYYTYMDASGQPLYDFTKRIIRRYPAGMGTACYHITDWVPQIIPQALTLLRHVRLIGLANVEFKLDPRDGQYKLIECNARFTNPNCLVAAAGMDLGRFVYSRIVGLPLPEMKSFKSGLRLWSPAQDFACFLDLRRSGELTFGQWFKSVLHRQSFPYWSWTDPKPTLVRALRPLKRLFKRRPAAAPAATGPAVAVQA